MEKIVIAYVPVLHDGYRKFFERHNDATTFYILGKELIGEVYYLSKEIRELDPKLMQKALAALDIGPDVKILTPKILAGFEKKKLNIILPNEDVSKLIWEKYFPKQHVILDSIFLRWDKHNIVLDKPVVPDKMIARDELTKKLLKNLEKEAQENSPDWWRRIGAAVVKDGKIILKTYNRHVPSDHMPYVNGDPRAAFNKGVHLELSTVIHAEAGLVAEAARQGISLKGADMYVTTFPCPPCAKQIAYAGIKNLYCGGGYGVLDGQDILKAKGVKIFFVEEEGEEQTEKNKKDTKKEWKGYKK